MPRGSPHLDETNKSMKIVNGLPAGGPDLAAGLAKVDKKALAHLGLL